MTEMELYKLWCEKAVDDPDLQTELKSIEGDEAAIQDRFYRDLEFGTGGLRGVIGAGAYRLNVYTIRRATQGLADYVNGAFENGSVAIAYDSRIKSDKFAKEAAAVLAANGIKVYIYSELMPTPMLSWAVRELKCQAGIVITASILRNITDIRFTARTAVRSHSMLQTQLSARSTQLRCSAVQR